MGRPLFYEIMDKPTTSFVIALCSLVWFYIQKNGVGYSHVGMSYQAAVNGHYWRIVTSAFSHISSILHLVFNMSALWGLGIVERLGYLGLSVKFYLEYTLVLVLLSGVIVLGMYHLLISRLKVEYFRRVLAVGQALVGYAIAWGVIHGMNSYWAASMLGWTAVLFVYSLKRSGANDFSFLEIESITDPSLPSLRFLSLGMIEPYKRAHFQAEALNSCNLDVLHVSLFFEMSQRLLIPHTLTGILMVYNVRGICSWPHYFHSWIIDYHLFYLLH